MSPRHLIPAAAVIALAAGGVTAIALNDDDNDNSTRTIAVTSVVPESPSSLDTLIPKGEKLSFSVADARPILSGVTVLRGRLERSSSGELTGRIEAPPYPGRGGAARGASPPPRGLAARRLARARPLGRRRDR